MCCGLSRSPRLAPRQAVINGVVFGCVVAVLAAIVSGARGALVTGALGFAVGAAVAVPSIRRRHLVADTTGLVARRNGYVLRARWDDLLGFEHTRFAAVVPVTMLRLNDAVVVSDDAEAVDPRRMAKIRRSGADRRIQLSTYVRRPGIGGFGDLLHEYRPDLATHT